MGLHSSQRWGIRTSKITYLRQRAGLDSKAQLSAVFTFPLKQGLYLGSAPLSLWSFPIAAHRQLRAFER